jgi:hypothetical protein
MPLHLQHVETDIRLAVSLHPRHAATTPASGELIKAQWGGGEKKRKSKKNWKNLIYEI